MFSSRYPQAVIKHPRVLCSMGSPRGVTIYPRPFWTPPPEVVHRQSCILPLPHDAEQVAVIEWTDGPPDHHLVDL